MLSSTNKPSATSYEVFLHVHTPVGEFTGFASEDFPTIDEAYNKMNDLQEMIRDCDCFTFASDKSPGTEITLAREVITNSVFVFSVVQGLKTAIDNAVS